MLNFHAHTSSSNSIINISSSFDKILDIGIFSAGLHPWFLNRSTFQQELNSLKKNSDKENVVAIGECGLDKVHNTPWDLQLEAFIAQIQLANSIKKPLIIHCVRAYDEIMLLLDDHKNSVPVIFHGFNKSILLAKQILHKGYFLSFGKSIFFAEKAEVFRQVPLDRLFLETDSASLPIEEVYIEAAKIKSVSLNDLDDAIDQNIRSVFGKSLYYV